MVPGGKPYALAIEVIFGISFQFSHKGMPQYNIYLAVFSDQFQGTDHTQYNELYFACAQLEEEKETLCATWVGELGQTSPVIYQRGRKMQWPKILNYVGIDFQESVTKISENLFLWGFFFPWLRKSWSPLKKICSFMFTFLKCAGYILNLSQTDQF